MSRPLNTRMKALIICHSFLPNSSNLSACFKPVEYLLLTASDSFSTLHPTVPVDSSNLFAFLPLSSSTAVKRDLWQLLNCSSFFLSLPSYRWMALILTTSGDPGLWVITSQWQWAKVRVFSFQLHLCQIITYHKIKCVIRAPSSCFPHFYLSCFLSSFLLSFFFIISMYVCVYVCVGQRGGVLNIHLDTTEWMSQCPILIFVHKPQEDICHALGKPLKKVFHLSCKKKKSSKKWFEALLLWLNLIINLTGLWSTEEVPFRTCQWGHFLWELAKRETTTPKCGGHDPIV